jgi:hypothetical protein
LHDVQGFQHTEIAAMVGRSVGDSKSQLHKARMRLRELLHEVHREKLRDERLAGRKLRSRSSTALLPLTANNAWYWRRIESDSYKVSGTGWREDGGRRDPARKVEGWPKARDIDICFWVEASRFCTSQGIVRGGDAGE